MNATSCCAHRVWADDWVEPSSDDGAAAAKDPILRVRGADEGSEQDKSGDCGEGHRMCFLGGL